ncbi:MAG TPA: cytochrome c maturation protein CcmE [Longimicrobiales bacterium]
MTSQARRPRRVGLIIGILVIVGSFGYLIYGGIGKNLVYFVTPTELLARDAAARGEAVRLGGQVVPGSVHWDAEALDLRFRITDGRNVIRVHSTGAPPQMFRDGIGVVIEGRLGPEGVFESTNLMVKHSNEYRPPHEGEMPKEMYRTLIQEAGT